jgi:hypothetical protein
LVAEFGDAKERIMDGRRIDGLRAKKKEETAQESDPA